MGPGPRNSAEEGVLASLAYEWDKGNSFSEFEMALTPLPMEQQVGLERSEPANAAHGFPGGCHAHGLAWA
jgi:hypothetical protein